MCLTFPGAEENVQWGNDLVFKAGGRMFAVACLDPARVCLSFKTTPEKFEELRERPGVVPAPYLARAKWVALETDAAIPRAELKGLLRQSYDLIVGGLTKAKRPRER